MKFVLKTEDKIFIVTKNDIFHEINIYDVNIQLINSSDEISVIEKTIVEELCFKKIIDVNYGRRNYIARTEDGRVFCWGNNYYGQMGNGKHDEDFIHYNKPELNELLSDLNINFIKCGHNHLLALTRTGELYAWGYSKYGQNGKNFDFSQLIPIKIKGFEGETIIDISCGHDYSMALTSTGRVFSWGDNKFCQLGIDLIKPSSTPKLIKLNNVFIIKISCSQMHSLLLSIDGTIYAFGNNVWGQIGNGTQEFQKRPIKLNHDKKFIDIASHWSENISIALSLDNFYYIWGDSKEKNILTPIVTNHKSIYEIYVHHFDIYIEGSEELIEFSDLSFRNGYYERNFIEIEELGKGSFGTVYKSMIKGHENSLHAIKKIFLKKEHKNEIFREVHRFSVVNKLFDEYVVSHVKTWVENSEHDNIILYVWMDLCDKTLENIIEDIRNCSNLMKNRTLTPIGYYTASQLFVEILESVQYLHENSIIHRDLNPNNIMLMRDNERIIRIVDFGLIAIHEFADQSHSSDKGHIKYAAQEVLNGRKYDTKADIYSLGILLGELFRINNNK
jgi:hypothetical protein